MTETVKCDSVAEQTPQRRIVTILFADLSESTRIARTVEAEEYCDLLERLRVLYHRSVADHEGIVAQISGDGMLAAFGFPMPREDDAVRAVRAALALRDSVRALAEEERWRGLRPRLHCGAHSGRVLFAEGDEVRGRFELLGRPTNIASRLCGHAGPDEILITETSLGPGRHLFQTSPTRHVQLRGEEQPVAIVSVIAQAPRDPDVPHGGRGAITPFVGRERELRILRDALQQVSGGDGLALEVAGRPGEGKTRLVNHFLDEAAGLGWPVHRGECDAAAEPLQPFLQIVRSLFGISPLSSPEDAARQIESGLASVDRALLPTLATWLRLLSLGNSPPRPEEAAAALRALIAASARRRPLILFIDDWHLADDASRAMLVQLEAIAGLLLLTTARSDGRTHVQPAQHTLELQPFEEAETGEILAQLLPAPDPFLAADIHNASGGKPLFIEELCHALTSGYMEHPREGSSWLATVVQSRLARLPEEQANLVRIAAIIGNVVPSWLFEEIGGGEADDAAIGALADQDFIFPGERQGTLRFKHGLTREIVYGSLGFHERQLLHLRIAAALQKRSRDLGEEEPLDALAYHHGAAGDAAATAHYAKLAGDNAFEISALDRAQAHYCAALDALDRLPESPDVARRWRLIAHKFGHAAVCDPSRDHLPVFHRAIEHARRRGDQAALMSAHYWLGYIDYALGEPAAAMAQFERGLDLAARAGDERLILKFRAGLGQVKQAACDYDDALPLLDEAIGASTPARSGVEIAYSLSCKGFALGDMGRFAEAHAHFEKALAALGGSRRDLQASILDQRSAVCLWQGRMEDALQFAREAEELGRRIGSRYDFAMSRALAAYARWKLQPSPEAVDAMMEATAWLEENHRNQYISLNYGWLAEMLAESGRAREACRYAARARRRARSLDPMGEAMALRAAARVAARAGMPGRAAHHLASAIASARARKARHEIAVTRLCEAELALEAGNRRKARQRLADARQAFTALEMRWFDRRATRLARQLSSGESAAAT